MNYLLLALLFVSIAQAQTGIKPSGPKTMGQPSYPNSGPLGSRSNDVTGEDMSSASRMSSDVNPTVPTRTPDTDKQEQQEEEVFPSGPYENGEYKYFEKKD